MDDLVIPKIPRCWGAEGTKMVFDQYLYLLKRSLFLKYSKTISFSFYMKYSWENCWNNFLGAFFGHPNCSNGIKTHLDAALVTMKIYCDDLKQNRTGFLGIEEEWSFPQ